MTRQVVRAAPPQERKAARDALLGDVASGHLSPGQAEAKAKEQGLGLLNPTPSSGAFEPMREPHWTLAMALAWIESPGNVDRVRECMPARRRNHWSWRAEGRGYRLVRTADIEPILKMDFADLSADSEAMTFKEAKRQLWEKLSAGELTASVVVDGQPTAIAAVDWAFLETASDEACKDVLVVRGRVAGVHSPQYRADGVLLRSADVMVLWPAPTRKGRPAKKGPRASELMLKMREEGIDIESLSQKDLALMLKERGCPISPRMGAGVRRKMSG